MGSGDSESYGGTGEVLAALAAAVSAPRALDLASVPSDEVLGLLDGLEVHARQVDAARLAVLAEVDRRGLAQADGHASAKVLARHRCRLSSAEAARRARSIKALAALPVVAAAFEDGAIGSEQINLVARVHANPRVRDALTGFQDQIVRLAVECPYPTFEAALREWERRQPAGLLADADGPEPRLDRAHQRRFARLTQDPGDLSWKLEGSFGALQGAKLHAVFNRYLDAEWETDWAEARAANGDDASEADLARTPRQRAADALEQMAERAASAPPGAKRPEVVHDIVWDYDTYQAAVHQISCDDPYCTFDAHATGHWYDPATYRCETIDGDPLNPIEAAIDSLHHHIRLVLTTGDVPTHIGSKQRLFTGRNRLAVKLRSTTCIWGNPSGCLAVGCGRVPVRPTTSGNTPRAGPPNPTTAHHCAEDTTGGNRNDSPQHETPSPDGGEPTAPTAPKSPDPIGRGDRETPRNEPESALSTGHERSRSRSAADFVVARSWSRSGWPPASSRRSMSSLLSRRASAAPDLRRPCRWRFHRRGPSPCSVTGPPPAGVGLAAG